MKMFGDYKNATALMQPGIVTQTGFLGDDQRSLLDIIQQDEKLFRSLGLDWDEVASRLQTWQAQAARSLGEPATVDGKWNVQYYEARGQLPCPFGDKLLNKNTVMVSLINTDLKILFSDLSVHLLQEHHFLQGKGSPFRMEPTLLKQLLIG